MHPHTGDRVTPRPRDPTIEGAINIGLAVIAVLRRAEFWEGHVTSAENIPLDEVPDRLDEIDRDHPLRDLCGRLPLFDRLTASSPAPASRM